MTSFLFRLSDQSSRCDHLSEKTYSCDGYVKGPANVLPTLDRTLSSEIVTVWISSDWLMILSKTDSTNVDRWASGARAERSEIRTESAGLCVNVALMLS